ncbi:DUF6033 family protein [Oxalobacter sp. OttesenSCG-928-P03]|nr:DUF6033 family protein [Oxalobacter sp. OttesenSCG-928-P03]
MPVKVGNTNVSEAAYQYASQRVQNSEGGKSSASDVLRDLKNQFPDATFSTSTQPGGSGIGNIAIAPNILRQMAEDPEKRLEYEALIYDMMEVTKTLPGQFASQGSELTAQGWIIDSNGELSSWSSGRTKSGNDSQFNTLLPRNDKESWIEKLLKSIQESIEKAGETSSSASSNPKGNLHIVA